MFILGTTKRFTPEHRRKNKTEVSSRKRFTFNYFFDVKGKRVQVCKLFYCGTLAISQKPIYTAHEKKNSSTNTPGRCSQGKHTKKIISDDEKTLVMEHINSFPRVPSHYCRADSNREYLDQCLNIKKMYELYVTVAQEKNVTPVKESAYRNIFCNNFNLYFHAPKKDRCDLCEEFHLQERENTCSDKKRQIFENHIKEKNGTREERERDRKGDVPVLSFDLENVLSLPKAEVSNFFYKSKFNVYNLTAHFSVTKNVYCAIWTENLMGRSGNDIASALYKILEQVLADHPNVTELILWADSCVPQNRNSVMSYALSYFLQEHPSLNNITIKFSTPGHSCVQEIDNVHSCIDRVLSKAEYYSPISLIRLLLKVNRKKPYRIIQLQEKAFKNFQECAGLFTYSTVPFTKVTFLKFSKCYYEIAYKTSHTDTAATIVANIKPDRSKRFKETVNNLPVPNFSKKKNQLPKNKVDAIKSMFRWMPEVDKEYYHTILPK